MILPTITLPECQHDAGTTGVAHEAAATAAVTVVANVEAMVIDAATGELHEGADDDDDGNKTTIYQHGVCQ